MWADIKGEYTMNNNAIPGPGFISDDADNSAYPLMPITDSYLYSQDPTAWMNIKISEEIKDRAAFRSIQEYAAKNAIMREEMLRIARGKEEIRINAEIARKNLTHRFYLREGYIIGSHERLNEPPLEASPIACSLHEVIMYQNASKTDRVLSIEWHKTSQENIKIYLREEDWTGLFFYRKCLNSGIRLNLSKDYKVTMDGILGFILTTEYKTVIIPEHYGWIQDDTGFSYRREEIWKDILARC